ncbi:hypothetical protein PHMEG_00027991 [Phytophthora megakarya]|uniref:Uncharacterized protein n=1 Tax=Phytophthora megakarya TaxID=4795 RepID=A0A225V5K9_9STRA|nr:hypothetical protein PHMEG_00027991 [Phytophthora megakarya]
MTLLYPEAITHHASQGPYAINAHHDICSSSEKALLDHIQRIVSVNTARRVV